MDINDFSIVDFDWSHDLENEFTEYISNCESLIDAEFYAGTEFDNKSEFETLSGQPFCGCETCYVREQLWFLVPRIIDGYKKGKVVVPEDEK